MKRNLGCRACGFGLAALVAFSASLASAQTAEEVIDMSIKAQGGREALSSVKSVQRTGEMFVDGAFGQMEGTMEVAMVPGKKAYQSMDLGVFQQESGFDGEVAWQTGMAGIEKLEGERAAQIKQAVSLNPFIGMLDAGAKAEKLDDETVDEVEYFVIQMTPPDGEPLKMYVEKETGFAKRMTRTMNNPMFGEVEMIIETTDYAEFGSIKLPTFQHLVMGEQLEVDTEFTETKVDEELDESIFAMPEADPAPSSDAP